ncbi:hypothetical protein [Streptomyces fulvoviolaceus]|uniref:hypothetical protein n=1 Tax=Streptomyces fulvoviolaceus TaxID=285535 RepID=UPI0018FEA333|nr:hypothetical protein [Streptomyces fulvoviolaceus]
MVRQFRGRRRERLRIGSSTRTSPSCSRGWLVRVEAAGLSSLGEKGPAGEFQQVLPDEWPLILGNDLAWTVIGVGTEARGSSSPRCWAGKPTASCPPRDFVQT